MYANRQKSLVANNSKNRTASSRFTCTAPAWSKPIDYLPAFERLESRRLLSASAGLVASPFLTVHPDASGTVAAPYSPAQIDTAYGINTALLPNDTQATGAGQTIAIIDAYGDPSIQNDLNTFDRQYGLAPAHLSVVNQTGSTRSLPSSNANWDIEISLDVEWAHAVAPGANILLVEATSSSYSNLMTAVNYARNVSGVSTISMSWGSSEWSGETQLDSYFTTPAGHAGETFVAASGDAGSASGPEWPASSPNVLAVGGTALTLANSSGAYLSETAWSGSTGGTSLFETEPGYQAGAQSSGYRTTPDVAYDASPTTGVIVYDSQPYSGHTGWWNVGGTSAGSPQWAAILAIANQVRAANGLASLDGASQSLPDLYAIYSNPTQYAQSFHDITSGSTSATISATIGYDMATGLGSPQAGNLIATLGTVGKPAGAGGTSGTSGTSGNGNFGGSSSQPPGHHRDKAQAPVAPPSVSWAQVAAGPTKPLTIADLLGDLHID